MESGKKPNNVLAWALAALILIALAGGGYPVIEYLEGKRAAEAKAALEKTERARKQHAENESEQVNR